jgi:glutathione S-transferase
VTLRILGRRNSSNVQKVLWCCGELGLAFKQEDVGGAFGGNRTAAYLERNPTGLIPTLIEEDGFALWESNSILRYLASAHGPESFYPAQPRRRAAAEKWMDWQLSAVNPAITPVFWGLVRTAPEQRDGAAIARARDQLAQALAILERQLASSPWVTGEAFGVADIPLGIMVHRWFQLPMEREEYPQLARWYAALRARPAFREHVDHPLS